VAPPITVSLARRISEAEIARRAFEIFCARGGQHGQHLEDWLAAERELLSATSLAASAPVEDAADGGTRPARKRTSTRKPRLD
jgi:hypothetical protein